MRAFKDQTGVVFDVYEDNNERFLEIAAHLRETDSKIEFEIQRCLVLPDLGAEGGVEQFGWRGQ